MNRVIKCYEFLVANFCIMIEPVIGVIVLKFKITFWPALSRSFLLMLTRRINAKSVCTDRCFDRCKELSCEALILRISLFAYSCYEYLDLVVTSCGFSLSLCLISYRPIAVRHLQSALRCSRPTICKVWILTLRYMRCNSTEQKSLWESNSCLSSQEIPSSLWNTHIHYRLHRSPQYILLFSSKFFIFLYIFRRAKFGT